MTPFKPFFLLAIACSVICHEPCAQITKRIPLSEPGAKYTQTISEEEIRNLNDIMAPVRERLTAIFKEDNSGRFSAYKKDVQRLNAMKSNSERDAFAKKITEQYNGFMSEAWAKAGINENEYQAKILKAISHVNPKTVTFMPYLVFFFNQAPPAAVPPERPLECLNVCTIADGKVNGDGALITGGGGSYANCNLRASAWVAAVGGNTLNTTLNNNISIPGTFPADNRTLHFKKSFDLNISATTFAVLGFSLAEASVVTNKTIQGITLVSPVLYGTTQNFNQRMTEDYVLSKADVAKSRFFLSAHVFSYFFISAGWSEVNCNNIKWTVCEEKQ